MIRLLRDQSPRTATTLAFIAGTAVLATAEIAQDNLVLTLFDGGLAGWLWHLYLRDRRRDRDRTR